MAADWSRADWTQSDGAIAAALGVSRTRVGQKRAALAFPRPEWAASLSQRAWAAVKYHHWTPKMIRDLSDEALLLKRLVGRGVLAELRRITSETPRDT